MEQNKNSEADQKNSDVLLVDSVYDEQELEKQAKEMQPIFVSYVTEAARNKDQSTEAWLTGRLKEDLPEKTDEEIHGIVDDILQTVKIQEEKSTSLHEAINSGRSRESWFANECRKATSGMTAQEAGKYLQTVDDAVSRANEEMTKTIMTSAGQVSQNPSLHGFIAEQYHVQTFNQNAAARGSQYHAEVLGPTDHGYSKNSVDIVIKDKNGKVVRRYQSKYCENSKLTERAFDSGDYRGQRKLVPSEQAGDLSGKNVTDHIEAPDGTSSTPLSSEKAKEIQHLLKEDFVTDYDTSGTVGKRYRRQDEVGTPFCVTVDYDTIQEKKDDGTPNELYNTVTVRYRDSMEQERVALDDLVFFIQKAIKNYKPVTK